MRAFLPLPLFLLLLCLAGRVAAHDGLDVEPPSSEAEAWNTLRLCETNMRVLLQQGQVAEIPLQATISNQALRFLRMETERKKFPSLASFLQAEDDLLQLFRAATRGDPVRTGRELEKLSPELKGLAAGYDPATVAAEVYSCPMCRGVRELSVEARCFKCGMRLVPRSIPASSVYNTPGEPSLVLAPVRTSPLRRGEAASVTLQLSRKKDGAAVKASDLLIQHTEKIHLLIVDESLTDYHHEHPLPEGLNGEYTFRFTPRMPGTYRVFSDVVPALSNVQEYAVCDLVGSGQGGPVVAHADKGEAKVDGLRYDLAWELAGEPLRARQPARATVHVSMEGTGLPFASLEPIMGTYAHLVAFHEDRTTVLHIHPLGTDPQSSQERGGPDFSFQFYAPKAGLYRLYCQVQVAGKARFAPFVINVKE